MPGIPYWISRLIMEEENVPERNTVLFCQNANHMGRVHAKIPRLACRMKVFPIDLAILHIECWDRRRKEGARWQKTVYQKKYCLRYFSRQQPVLSCALRARRLDSWRSWEQAATGNGGSPKGLSAMHRPFGPWEWCNFQNTKYDREVQNESEKYYYELFF